MTAAPQTDAGSGSVASSEDATNVEQEEGDTAEQEPDIAEALLRETGRIFADLLRLSQREQNPDVASIDNNS